jgi:NADH-quinone oxidoreductase subunit G
MATIIIDGQSYELPEGAKFNAIQAAKHFGIDIPYYCWHPALSVVANCRMCEIEVGTKDPNSGEIRMLPRLVPGCQTPARDGTVLVTESTKVLEHRKNIMELLLINHPLDCPVCDQAGECGLQDYSYSHGRAEHRFVEERNVNPKKEVSDLIVLNQDRCIMCTRCVRFTREITGTAELHVMRRGDHGEIAIFPDQPLDNPLAGNVVDLCPVGALLDKDFLHNQRVWFLSKHDGICTGCASGCNLSVEENAGRVWRHKPRHNPYVNDYWICDEGRYGYKAANAPDLLSGSYVLEGADHRGITADRFVKLLNDSLTSRILDKESILGILSPFLSVEEAFAAAQWLRRLSTRVSMAMGPVPVVGRDVVFSPDKVTGRSGDTSFLSPREFVISSEKAPNRAGVSMMLDHFMNEVIPFEKALETAESKDIVIVFGGYTDASWITPDQVAVLRKAEVLILFDTTINGLADAADLVSGVASFAEKSGCYINASGRIQRFEAALPPREGVWPLLDMLAMISGFGPAPIRSQEILKIAAQTVAGLTPVADGVISEFGSNLNGQDAPIPDAGFEDDWTLANIAVS